MKGGAVVGGAIGAWFGGAGAAIGGFIGGVGGAIGDGILGRWGAGAAYDLVEEQFWAYGADPSLGDRVRPRCSHWCTQDADAFAGEHGIEGVVNLLPCLGLG